MNCNALVDNILNTLIETQNQICQSEEWTNMYTILKTKRALINGDEEFSKKDDIAYILNHFPLLKDKIIVCINQLK